MHCLSQYAERVRVSINHWGYHIWGSGFVSVFDGSFAVCFLYYIYSQQVINMYLQLWPKLYTNLKHIFSLESVSEWAMFCLPIPTWARKSLMTKFVWSFWWNGHRGKPGGITHPVLPQINRSLDSCWGESETDWVIYKNWGMRWQLLVNYQ